MNMISNFFSLFLKNSSDVHISTSDLYDIGFGSIPTLLEQSILSKQSAGLQMPISK